MPKKSYVRDLKKEHTNWLGPGKVQLWGTSSGMGLEKRRIKPESGGKLGEGHPYSASSGKLYISEISEREIAKKSRQPSTKRVKAEHKTKVMQALKKRERILEQLEDKTNFVNNQTELQHKLKEIENYLEIPKHLRKSNM